MAGATNTFETGLAPATVITGANSGGSAGTAFGSNFYVAGTGATVTYDDTVTMHGTLAGKIALTASSGASMGFNTGDRPHLWTRGYFRHTTVPNANTILHAIRDGAVSASGFQVRLMTSGALQLLDRSAFVGVSTSPALTLDRWYRVEVSLHINGAWQWWLYDGNSTVPLHTESGTIATTAAAKFDFCRWGFEGSSLTQVGWLDDLAWSDEAKIGPAALGGTAPPQPRPVALVRSGGAWI